MTDFRSRLLSWLAPSLFCLSVLVVLSPGLFRGEILGFRDTLHFYFPIWHYLDQQPWIERILPDWNRFDAGGVSWIAEPTTATFYPGRIFLLLPGIPLGSRIAIYLGFHLVLACFGMMRLARKLGMSSGAASLAGIAFAWSGPIYFQIYNPIYLVSAAWVPFAAWSWVDELRDDSSFPTRPFLERLIGLSIPLAMMILGGDPQTPLHVLLVVACLVLLRKGFDRRALCVRPLLTCCMAGVVASLLAAIQILPTLDWISFGRRGSVGGETYEFSVAPWHWLTFVLPRSLGSFAGENSRWISGWNAEGRMWVASLHLGSIGLFGVFLSFRSTEQRSLKRALIAISVLSIGSALGAYGLGWLARSIYILTTGVDDYEWTSDPFGGLQWVWNEILPGYASFRYPAKWLTLSSASLALLAGIGFDHVVSIDYRRYRHSLVVGVVGLLGISTIASLLPWISSLRDLWIDWCESSPKDSLCGPVSHELAWFGVVVSIWSLALVGLLSLLILRWIADRDRRLLLLFILALLELSFHGWRETHFVSESHLLEAVHPVGNVPVSRDESSVERLAADQVRRRIGKLHLLVPQRNWNAQLSLTPRAYSELRAQVDRLRDPKFLVELNAGWVSRSEQPWRLPELQDSQGTIVARWERSNRIEIEYDTVGATVCLLPLFDDGGWSVTSDHPQSGEAKLSAGLEGLNSRLALPAGQGRVVVQHRTPWLGLGAILSAAAWIAAVIVTVRNWLQISQPAA